MQLTGQEKSFNVKKTQQLLASENKYITSLFAILPLPVRHDDEEEKVEDKSQSVNFKQKEGVTRAKSLTELQERLHAITSKKKLSYKEKITKKNLKNRMKKKTKHDERNAQQKLIRSQNLTSTEIKNETKLMNGTHIKIAKPIFNSEGKMVFSKFDFSNLGTKKEKKIEKDPRKLLENLEKQKEKFEELTEAGNLEKAIEIKEKSAWKNALAKAEGKKIKDDPILLHKTVQRQEQKKRASKKKWEVRQERVEKSKQERQQKRSENIDKRKKEKKKNKFKKAVKKGKIIPGF